MPVVGTYHLLVAHTVGVLPFRRAHRDEETKRILIGHLRLLVRGLDVLPKIVVEPLVDGIAITPILLDGFPEVVVNAFHVGVTVLDNQGFDPVRMGRG